MNQAEKVLGGQREYMTINERLLAESQFRVNVREKYPNGPPRVKIGTKVETIYGPGVVVDIEEAFKKFYPSVEFEVPPLHTTGQRFNRKVLRMFPYDFDFSEGERAIQGECWAQ